MYLAGAQLTRIRIEKTFNLFLDNLSVQTCARIWDSFGCIVCQFCLSIFEMEIDGLGFAGS